jgi:hypothetical protein
VHNIIARPEQSKRFVFEAASSYVDTATVFWPRTLRREQIQDIKRHVGKLKVIRDRTGRLLGYSHFCQRPSAEKILLLDRLAEQYRGVLSRFDLAVDFHTVPSEQIRRSAVLRWQRSGAMLDIGDSTYWVDWPAKYKRRGKRSNRNIGLYDDKHNRHTGELDCKHLELKFLNAGIVRKQGINRVRDLLTVNPKKLFDKHVKWVNVSAIDADLQAVVRRTMKEERLRHQNKRRKHSKRMAAFMDTYRNNLLRRLRTLIRRGQHDRAQSGPYRHLKGVGCPVNVPTHLTEGQALQSLENFLKTRLPVELS